MRLTSRLWSRLVLLAIIAAGWFVVFETGLRLAGGTEAAPEFQRLFMPDSRIGYRLRPGVSSRFRTAEYDTTISINAQGVRDDEFGPKPANERRIVVLGDSLVMSVQVALQQTFCKILEARLNGLEANGPIHYRVINAGVQGYATVEKYLFFTYVARAFEPDLVLVGLYPGNDTLQVWAAASKLTAATTRRAATGQDQPAAEPTDSPLTWARRIARRSMVLQIVQQRLKALRDRFTPRAPSVPSALMAYLQQPPPSVKEALEVTHECVSRIAAEAAAQHARTGVLLIPARFQVDDDDFSRLAQTVSEAGQILERDAATERLTRALADLDVPVFDALPALRDAARGGNVYFLQTAHLTPRGHEAIGSALDAFLASSGLLRSGSAR